MGYQAGYEAKIQVNGQNYSGAEWSCDDSCGDIDVTNTEGTTGDPAGTGTPGLESHLGGPAVLKIMIKQATFNDDENPFEAPFSLDVQTYAEIEIFPAGLAGKSYHIPSCLILASNYNGTAKAAQPLAFSGISDGDYTVPSV